MALPEVADAECDAARWTTDITQATRAMALCGVEPGVAVGGAFADRERIRIRLQQCPVAERGDVLHSFRDHRADRARGGSFYLRLARSRAGIATQAREAAHGFGEQTVLLADEAHVTIVQRVVERRREPQAESADEILRFVAVEHDGVQHAQAFGACIEIQSQRKRQPFARAIRVFAFELHHRAHRPALFDGDFLERTLEILLTHLGVAGRSASILEQQNELAVPQRLASAAGNGFDDSSSRRAVCGTRSCRYRLRQRSRFPSRSR